MLNPIRILLVDDNPHFLEAARVFLHVHEARAVVETATNAEEAIEKSRHLEFDVILLDLNLDDRFGLDLIPHFREHLPHVKIIVLSIMSGAAYRAASLQAGADAFVDKITMNRTLVPTILQQMDRPAGEQKNQAALEQSAAELPQDQKAGQAPAAPSEQPEIEDDKEPNQ